LKRIGFRLEINPIPFRTWRNQDSEKNIYIGAYSAGNKIGISPTRVECSDPSLEYIIKDVGLIPEVMNIERKKLSEIVNKAVINGLKNKGVDISKVDGKNLINGYLYFDSKELLTPKKEVSPQFFENIFLKEKDKYDIFWVGYLNNFILLKEKGQDKMEYSNLQLPIYGNEKAIIKHSAINGELNKIQNILGDFAKGWEVKKP